MAAPGGLKYSVKVIIQILAADDVAEIRIAGLVDRGENLFQLWHNSSAITREWKAIGLEEIRKMAG